MQFTIQNLDRVFKMLKEQHADNSEHAEFDDETDLLYAIKRVVNEIKEEGLFMCDCCGGGFMREEMAFDINDQDLCKVCNSSIQHENFTKYGK
jgi:hypothetical protein